MRTDNVVRIEAMSALIAALGAVDAERFISMVKRDKKTRRTSRRVLPKRLLCS